MTQYVIVLLSQKAISLSCKSNALIDGTVSTHNVCTTRVYASMYFTILYRVTCDKIAP